MYKTLKRQLPKLLTGLVNGLVLLCAFPLLNWAQAKFDLSFLASIIVVPVITSLTRLWISNSVLNSQLEELSRTTAKQEEQITLLGVKLEFLIKLNLLERRVSKLESND